MGRLAAQLQFFWYLIKEFFVSDEIDYSDYPDQTDKTWIVTGSTAGIGLNVATELASLGAKVWLVGRNEAKTLDVIQSILNLYPDAKLDYLLMDFQNLASVKPGAQKFLSSGDNLNGIVHNAGYLATKLAETKDGYDGHVQVNNIAPWLLQKLLDPVLIKSSETKEGRIVWVSSLTHWGAPFSGAEMAKDPSNCGSDNEPYFVSKAINIMQSIQWTELHPTANIKSLSVHPGVNRTALNDVVKDMSAVERWTMDKLMRDPSYGASVELAAALGPFENNDYLVPWGKKGTARSDIVAAGRDRNLSLWLDTAIKPFS